jgi:molybdopterin-guanine dinucleotide biosynthesis protein A
MNLSAVLLAGGQSRRMGRDKAFLEIDGGPLWRRQLAKLELVSDEVFVSVHDASSLPESGARRVFDPPGACGPLAGLAAALHGASRSHLLVLAVDMPAMTPGYLRSLAARMAPGCGVVPVADGYFQGTAAIYPREILPLAEDVLKGGDLSFQNLIRRAITAQMMEAVPVADAELPLFVNWNTPEEVQDSR